MAASKTDMRDRDVSCSTQQAPIYCICRSPKINVFMIRCDFCEEWYHGSCIGITEKESGIIDKFCCKQCKRKNPALRTTYKKEYSKNKNTGTKRKSGKSTISMNYPKTSNHDSAALYTIKTPIILARTSQTSDCLDFAGTTVRKAKTEAYEKFNQSSISEQGNTTGKIAKGNTTLKQCYGPGCTRASRKGSKYCSDACGITLAKHRILEILPQRIQQWNSTPLAAEEISNKKLVEIRVKQYDIEKQLQELDTEVIKQVERISKSKDSANHFVQIQCDDTTLMDCVLCGAEIPNKFITKHLEHCYMKLEKKVTTDDKIKPTDEKWNIFCNRKIAKNSWCKKMKVLCPLHYENFRKADEVCGYYLGEENGTDRYCGNKDRTCTHINWEEIQRAILDLEKLNLLLKFKDLKNEEQRVRREMSRRGDVLSLMCNFTIEH